MDYEQMKLETVKAVAKPKVGMRFHEMYSYWVYVIGIIPVGKKKLIVTREFSGHPSNPPADCITIKTMELEEFQEKVKCMLYCDDKALKRMSEEVYATSKELFGL